MIIGTKTLHRNMQYRKVFSATLRYYLGPKVFDFLRVGGLFLLSKFGNGGGDFSGMNNAERKRNMYTQPYYRDVRYEDLLLRVLRVLELVVRELARIAIVLGKKVLPYD